MVLLDTIQGCLDDSRLTTLQSGNVPANKKTWLTTTDKLWKYFFFLVNCLLWGKNVDQENI